MARVTVSVDGVVIKEYALSKERTTIGRKAHNDIQIEDSFLSGEHSAILLKDGHWSIEDLQSQNGTTLNGKSVKRHRLKPNDLIEYGDYRLSFITDVEDSAENFLVSRLVKTRPLKPLQ